MAGVQTFEEEFLTCGICIDIYTDPRTLSCGHTFCRKCLTQLIMTSSNAVQTEEMRCPSCRAYTIVPIPTEPVNEWAGQMTPCLVLKSLVDRYHTADKNGDGQDICFLCKALEETTLASSWCSVCEVTLCNRCVKMHLKGPSTKKHELFDLSEGVGVKQRRKVKCKEHDDELIKAICKDCKIVVCQTCCIISHAKHNFAIIETMIPEIKNALTENKRQIGKRITRQLAGVKIRESQIKKLRSTYLRRESEIKFASKTINTLLRDNLHNSELLRDLYNKTVAAITAHQAKIKGSQLTIQMYQQHCEFIDQALQSESVVDMYDMYQVCLSWAIEYSGDIDTVLCNTIDIKQRGDKNYADFIAVTTLTVEGARVLVVADSFNHCLKSIDARNRKIIDKLQLPDEPYRVITVSDSTIAATVRGKVIVIAEVKPEFELIRISTIETNKQYWGLASLSDTTLVAGSYPSPALDILDFTGNVLKKFTPLSTGLDLLQCPTYICTTHDNDIVVSDYRSKSVYCLTSEGDVVFTYKPTGDNALGNPQDVTVTSTGDILVADSVAKKIVQLTSEGRFVRNILTDDIREPYGLCSDDTSTLYVCDRATAKEAVQVFRFDVIV